MDRLWREECRGHPFALIVMAFTVLPHRLKKLPPMHLARWQPTPVPVVTKGSLSRGNSESPVNVSAATKTVITASRQNWDQKLWQTAQAVTACITSYPQMIPNRWSTPTICRKRVVSVTSAPALTLRPVRFTWRPNWSRLPVRKTPVWSALE